MIFIVFSNSQDCPDGSRDFRAEQCSEYDGMEFQGKRYKWLPYYGGKEKKNESRNQGIT